jgi:hypothetical protein
MAIGSPLFRNNTKIITLMISSKGIAWRIRRMIYLVIKYSFDNWIDNVKKFGWVGVGPTQPQRFYVTGSLTE